MKSTLRMQDVEKIFQQGKQTVTVLTKASALFCQGTTYALLGVSGTGKSTILQLLAGIDLPTDGSVTYNDKNIASFTDREHQFFLHTVIGLVFQMPYLIDELSVCENVMLKGLMSGDHSAEAKERARILLQQLGLENKIDSYPAALSGGEQQRVALARALFSQPQFLLADEPTAHLDSETKQLIMRLLLDVQKRSGMGVIIATHDQEIAKLLDVRLHIHHGQLVQEG